MNPPATNKANARKAATGASLYQRMHRMFAERIDPDRRHARDWREWARMFGLTGHAPHHATFWEHALRDDSTPFMGVWPRGHGKSTVARAAAVARAAERLFDSGETGEAVPADGEGEAGGRPADDGLA